MTAEELLMSEESEAFEYSNVITIDRESRAINVPLGQEMFGVEGDKSVSIKHFSCPKIVGDNIDIDLSEYNLYANYTISDEKGNQKSKDVLQTPCKNIVVNGENITFDWEISEWVTQEDGFIAFSIVAKKSVDGILQTRWYTTPAVGRVLKTIKEGANLTQKYPDVIDNLMNRVAELEKIIESGGGGTGGAVSSVNGKTGAVELTAEDVGALPEDTPIPTKTSDLNNDSGYITKAVTDLVNYYKKSETYTQDEVKALVSAIPKFSIQPVSSLPTTDISTTTVYLLKTGEETDNLYTEYIYVNGAWEYLGKQTVDLSGYTKVQIGTLESLKPISTLKILQATKEEYDSEKKSGMLDDEALYLTPEGEYLTVDDLEGAVNDALAQAKESGEFDGEDGTSVTITSVTESTEEGGSNVVTFSDGKTMTTKNGKNGKDGQDGKDGSDANVTSENIANALGYTPANKAEIATTAMKALSNSAVAYVKISGFGEWGTGEWYQKGFSMLVTSRAGEMIWVSLSSDDSNTSANALRLINRYGKINALHYSVSESAIYVTVNAWCNNVCSHILSNVNGDYVPVVESASALPSDAVQIPITPFGIDQTNTLIGNSSKKLQMNGSDDRPTYNGNNLALQSDIPSTTETWTFTLEDGSTVEKKVYVG